MTSKLTLRLNKDTIAKAKLLAQKKQTSLSVLVENYFKSLAKEENNSDFEISPIVDDLSGIIELPEDFNSKAEYASFLIEKYT